MQIILFYVPIFIESENRTQQIMANFAPINFRENPQNTRTFGIGDAAEDSNYREQV